MLGASSSAHFTENEERSIFADEWLYFEHDLHLFLSPGGLQYSLMFASTNSPTVVKRALKQGSGYHSEV